LVTIKTLRALKPGVWLSDGGARGAGTLVFRRSGGDIRAYFRYTQADGSRYALPLGHFDEEGCDGLTLAEARAKSGELSRLYLSGVKDLRAHLEAEEAARHAAEEARRAAEEAALAEAQVKSERTLIALCHAYADALEQQGKNKSASNARSVFKVHVYRAHRELAQTPAEDITPRDVAMLVRRVREAGKERTAGVLRSYLRAAYAMAIRAPFDSAVGSKLATFGVEMNPVDAIPTIPVRAGHRTLSAAELRDYLSALADDLPDLALKLAILAGGQRMSQLLRARVADYNADTQTLRLWDSKGKRREPREHLVPLAPIGAALVVQLIERAQHRSAHSFRGDATKQANPSLWLSTGGATMAETTPGKRLAEIAAVMQLEPFNLRDVRRTVETMLAGMGVSRETRAQLLSHGLGGVQMVHYDRYSYIDEKRAALVGWEAHLAAVMAGDVAPASSGSAPSRPSEDGSLSWLPVALRRAARGYHLSPLTGSSEHRPDSGAPSLKSRR
jgi:integrase